SGAVGVLCRRRDPVADVAQIGGDRRGTGCRCTGHAAHSALPRRGRRERKTEGGAVTRSPSSRMTSVLFGRLESQSRTDLDVEGMIVTLVAIQASTGVMEPGVADLGVECDARAHRVRTGRDDAVQLAAAARILVEPEAFAVVEAVRTLQAHGPRVHAVAQTAT